MIMKMKPSMKNAMRKSDPPKRYPTGLDRKAVAAATVEEPGTETEPPDAPPGNPKMIFGSGIFVPGIVGPVGVPVGVLEPPPVGAPGQPSQVGHNAQVDRKPGGFKPGKPGKLGKPGNPPPGKNPPINRHRQRSPQTWYRRTLR